MAVGIPCMDVAQVQLSSGETISVLDVCSISSVADSGSAPAVTEAIFDNAPFMTDKAYPEMGGQAGSFTIHFPLEKPPQR